VLKVFKRDVILLQTVW